MAGLEEFVRSNDPLSNARRWVLSNVTMFDSDQSSKLAALVNSKCFEIVVAIMILLSTVFAILEVNWQMAHTSYDTPLVFQTFDQVFIWAFAVEVVLKVIVLRREFFLGEDLSWNIFDLALAMVGLVDLILTKVFSSGIGNATFMRFARMLKLCKKVSRLVRLMHSFSDLRIILKCISGVMQPLFWSMIMLLGFILMFAIALVQQMTGYLIDHAHQLSEQEIKDIKDNFGSVQQCIFVLFSGTTGGHDWGETYSIVETAGPITSGCYTLYIGVVGLAITNVITSIFVDKAIRIASPGLHEQMMLKRREDLDLISDLRNLFSMIDVDTSLTISRSELLASLSTSKSLHTSNCKAWT